MGGTAEKIINAAIPLFADQGYAGVSVRAITKAAGVENVGAVSYYFGGKRELYLTILQEHFKGIQNLAKNIPQPLATPLEQLEFIVHAIHMTYQRSPYMIKLLFNEFRASSEFFPEIRENIAGMQRIPREIIQKGIDEGLFRPNLNPDSLTLMFYSIAHFVYLMPAFSAGLLSEGEEGYEYYFAQTMKCFFRGILVVPEEDGK